MAKYVMVMCGEWIFGEHGKWDFVICKRMMSRFVSLHDGWTLDDVHSNVCREFGVSEDGDKSVTLSYWPSEEGGNVEGNIQAPVLVTSDQAWSIVVNEFGRRPGMAMFVSFNSMRTPDSRPSKRARVMPTGDTAVSVSEDGGCCTRPEQMELVDDEDLFAHVEAVEASLGKSNTTTSKTDRSPFDLGIDSPMVERELFPEETEPHGYDTEFWAPLIDETFGGSNAPDIMCSPVDCGPSTEDGVGGGDQNVGDDDEDIPPMYDDKDVDTRIIPDLDLDVDPDGEKIEVGMRFSCKSDCQIALAIIAIKGMFRFLQTTTKKNYFVVTCVGEKCDWRVMAHEVDESGEYEIRKACVVHTCDIGTRNGYKKHATSKVLAAVYRNKFGTAVNGPCSGQLQQLVLEDLRVSASYIKCWRAREVASGVVDGLYEEEFARLAKYMYVLTLANPGTVTDIKSDRGCNGHERFLYCFLSFGGSISGFRKLRRVIVVDGTQLGGRYRGVLLTACGQ